MNWISVAERMPEVNDTCLIYGPEEGMYMAYLTDKNEHGRNTARKHKDRWPIELEWEVVGRSVFMWNITHWMPLPLTPSRDLQKEFNEILVKVIADSYGDKTV